MTLDVVVAEGEAVIAQAREAGLVMPGRIRFAVGAVRDVGPVARGLGAGAGVALVTGRKSAADSGLRARVAGCLADAGLEVVQGLAVAGEPTVAVIDEGAAGARARGPSAVVAVGGGSVIDAAKVIAALITNPGPVVDYLEGVGRGRQVGADPVPLIAIPTTSGTGAEMTKNGVVSEYEKGFKKSMRDDRMIPAAALLDPALTASVPRSVTAASGMDAITQLIESCISTRRASATTALAHRALRPVRAALPRCCEAPGDLAARGAMMIASAASGICLANAGLALVHGIASGLGGLYPVAHGLICGILLPHTLRYNRDACETEMAEALRHFLGEGAVDSATIERGIAEIVRLNAETGVPPDLRHLRLLEHEVRRVAEASQGGSMRGNPVPMDTESIYAFLRPLCI